MDTMTTLRHLRAVTLFVLIQVGFCLDVCSKTSNLKTVVENVLLKGSEFETFKGQGLLGCIRECQNRRRCKSVNYKGSGLCSLNDKSTNGSSDELQRFSGSLFIDIASQPGRLAGACENHSCSVQSTCRDVGGSSECVLVYCSYPAAPANGEILADATDDVFNPGDEVHFNCLTGYYKSGELVCQSGGSWSDSAKCQTPPASCAEVQKCHPSAKDGEYWIKPFSKINKAVKIFCQNMDSSDPQQFITVPEESNFAEYPDTDDPCSDHWNWESNICGVSTFQKLRVKATWNSLRVSFGNIMYFSNTCKDGTAPFGTAGNCGLSSGRISCSLKTTIFKINTTGTGLIVDPSTTWKVASGSARISWSKDKRVIQGECLAACDVCHADNSDNINRHFLVIDEDYQPQEQSANVVACP